MEFKTFAPSNKDGWRLYVKQHIDPKQFNPDLPPLAIVPGYGMNSYIFGYHPRGRSMVEYIASKGYEVWTMNFRGQDFTVRNGGKKPYGIRDIALVDMPAVIDTIMEETQSKRSKLDLIGCSLGGTYVFVHTALMPESPVGSIVAMGAPLQWTDVHPVLRAVFSQPRLVGLIRMSKTRALAGFALPIAARIPGLLHIYLHPAIVDLSKPELLIKTVEDPNHILNREIAEWIKNRDLVIDGINISERFENVTNPILCVQANADGVVPARTAMSALDLAGSKVKDAMMVGTDNIRMAHADMFISNYAQELVFEPMTDWLLARV